MSDDGPNYSRNIVQRRVVSQSAGVLAFVAFSCGGWLLLNHLSFGEAGPRPLADNLAVAANMGGAMCGGVVAGVLCGWAAGRIHRSLWPEHPDEE